MIACYDLARCPPTYDVVAFLALLEIERLRLGEEHVDLHILPGPAGGFRADSHWPRTIEERVHLRENVLVPLCRLLPSVRSVEVRLDRKVDGWGKGEYLVGLPAILRALRGGSRPLRGERLLKHELDSRLLTFTLREAEHHSLRNSRTAEWQDAASVLGMRGRGDVIILRDHRVEPIELAARAALYTRAALNIGISNGPMWMAIFMDAPVLMLRPTTNAASGCYDDRFYARCGLPRGSQLPTSPPHQRLVWEEDTRENIVRGVEEMLVCAS
ncbi:MAG: hypothetical protein Q7T33_14385 [Dehalococcoidia bacterium]|nr:hypothetical protein [Dehalococcoidia bacterium]